MSIAREPGRLRGTDGRARRVGWAVGVALFVAAVLFAVARMATVPTPPAEQTSRRAGAAATPKAADSSSAKRGRMKPESDAPVARVEIAERPVLVRPRQTPHVAPVAEPAVPARTKAAKADGDEATKPALSGPSLRPPAKAAEPRPAAPSPPLPAARKQERESEPADAPLVPEERTEARYPESAAADGVTGKVRLKVVVDPRGQVEDALVGRSSGDERLDHAAEEAVRRWRYRPARRSGHAVMATDYVEVEFYRESAAAPED
jgi:periplasmic protein TonB